MDSTVMEDENQDAGDDPLKITGKSWEKMKKARVKEGFREGKYSGEAKALQEGFNEGYCAGYQTHFNLAFLKGVIGAIETHLKSVTSSPEQLRTINELKQDLKKLEEVCRDLKNCSTSRQNPSDLDKDLECFTLNDDSKEGLDVSQQIESESNISIAKETNTTGPCTDHINDQLNVLRNKIFTFLKDYGLSSLCDLFENMEH